jgi:hypothetical protein
MMTAAAFDWDGDAPRINCCTSTCYDVLVQHQTFVIIVKEMQMIVHTISDHRAQQQ